ncbi:hypothetical protein D9M70_237170 [compost metagenome]
MRNGTPLLLALLLLGTAGGRAFAEDPAAPPEADSAGAETTPDVAATPLAEQFTFDQKLTLQGGYGPDNSVLGEDRKGFYSARYEPSLAWYSSGPQFPAWQGFARAWINYTSGQATSPLQEPNEQQPEYFSSELREFYLRRNLLGGDPRYALSAGRQKFADHYGIWWDDSIEALRFDYTDTFATGFVAVARKFHTYNTDASSLDANNRDIGYVMGEYALRWNDRNWIGVRAQYERDDSGDDPDDRRDFRGGRLGLFVHGDDLDLSPLFSDYRLELAALSGKLDLVEANGARNDRHTDGWALIGDLGKRFYEAPWRPRLSLRVGLTDTPSDQDDGFYLNNIQSDRVTNKEAYTSGLLSSFVSVDMHNLAFYSVAVETQPQPRHSFDVRLSDLYLRDSDGGIPINASSDLASSGSKSLAQVLDANYYWQMFPIGVNGRQLRVNLLASAGYFWSGSAIEGLGDDFQVSLGVVMRY